MSQIKSYIISCFIALFFLVMISVDIHAVVRVFNRLDNLERNCHHE